jgi:hypothetical protein
VFPELEVARLREIKEAITSYREQIRQQVATRKAASAAKVVILKYLDRYDNHLFGHPAKYDEGGRLISVVERTNNVAEGRFVDPKPKRTWLWGIGPEPKRGNDRWF